LNDQVSIKGWALGPVATNCYLLWAGEPSGAGGGGRTPAWLIDPGFGPGPALAEVKRAGLDVQRIILTHAHGDHIAGVRDALRGLAEMGGSRPILMLHALEATWLGDPMLNLSEAIGMPVTSPDADELLEDGQRLVLPGRSSSGDGGDGGDGGAEFRVLHTPGHSPGSVSLWCERAGVVISGDALFAGSVGRTDFPGADHATLMRSIREKLYTLPQNTRVLPGHGPETTVGHERLTNPYVRG